MAVDSQPLAYYATPGRHTILDEFPLSSGDVREIVTIVQGLLIDDTVAKPFYDVDLSREQADAIHERDSARLLAVVKAVDPRPFDQPRPPARRVGARCHSYSRLTVAMLRSAGVPARARCGFGGYFLTGWLEDHWITEFWDKVEERWTMIDPSLDATWQKMIGFAGDQFDLTTSKEVDVDPVLCAEPLQDCRSLVVEVGMAPLDVLAQPGTCPNVLEELGTDHSLPILFE